MATRIGVPVRDLLFLGLVLALLGTSVAHAGQIFVRTQPPVSGAVIEIDGRTEAVTGADGGALIDGLTPGNRKLVLVLNDRAIGGNPWPLG